jgi:hypothetical protein
MFQVKNRKIIPRFWLLSICSCLMLGFSVQASEDSSAYDRKWWFSVSKNQRLEFLEGYMACYISDTDGKIKFTESSYAYEPRVTNYLQSDSDEQTKSIEEIFWKMAQPPYARPRRRLAGPAEEWKGKYGYLDGDYWRQQREPDRIGFIQGFLYCYSKHAKLKRGSFSRPASWYVEAISKWYGVKSDDPAEIDLARINTKIPEVLFRFRDAGTR